MIAPMEWRAPSHNHISRRLRARIAAAAIVVLVATVVWDAWTTGKQQRHRRRDDACKQV
jgi:hypothetical protein